MSLREHDIRPQTLAVEQQRRFARDRERLLARASRFVFVACPACESDDGRLAFEKAGFSYRACNDCETLYVSPRPPPEVLAEYYDTSESYAYWNEVLFPASEALRRERLVEPRVDRILALRARHGGDRLVEIGAGFGTFAEALAKRGVFLDVWALEPSPMLAKTCRERGLHVIQSRVEDVALDLSADMAVSFEVIEHAFSPRAFLQATKRLLVPGGVLVLTCPNVQGFDIEVLGSLSPAVDFEHLNYFHPVSLARLLTRVGFDVLEHSTPGELDADIVRNRVLAGDLVLQDRFLRRVLVDQWDQLGVAFQRFLAENRLSSHMWMVARAPR